MGCCSELKTECLRVVTIKYLNDFIGDNVKDTSGNVKKAAGEDTYCPTYGELTGGSLIPNWSQGSSPFDDVDGIVVTGTYRGDQLVRQQDLQVKYTTFKTLTISRNGSGDLPACEGNETLSYVYDYERHVKSMNSSCGTDESTTTVNGQCSELTYHTSFSGLTNSGSSVTNCTAYHIGKNGEFSGPSENIVPTAPPRRCDNIYADVTFRGKYEKSNVLTICQEALTGHWSDRDRRKMDKFTVVGHPQNGGYIDSCSPEYVYLTGEAQYTDWYHWIDRCGTDYTDITSAITTTEGCDSKFCEVSGPSSLNCSGTAQFSYTSGSSSSICASGYVGYYHDCCDGTGYDSITLGKEFGGQRGEVTWDWRCYDCDTCENCPQNHTCADCADEDSSRWGCSNCAEELGCDKCAEELGCDKCAKELGCDECPDGPDCGDDGD